MKLIILDIDGVMTDGKKMYDSNGNVISKKYNDKDFTAIKRFIAQGINVCFLSGDNWNKTMADNRNIKFYSGRSNDGNMSKIQILKKILLDYQIQAEETIYVGDDIFDIEVFENVKEGFCPQDSPYHVKNKCTIINKNGGDGVIAELFDILFLRNEIINPQIDLVKAIDKKELTSQKMS